ncbi:MAG: hypothetical protein J6C85_04520 [Alphaproteobacteria bacterium]|nr:hypothetical protein [Alphaproteobacteria bacterium]
MKKIKFFACALASLFMMSMMVTVALTVPMADFLFWYMEFPCFAAAVAYGILAYNRRPWANPWS